MKTLVNGDEFPGGAEVKKKIMDNGGNVPIDLIDQLTTNDEETDLEDWTAKLMKDLDEAFASTYPIIKGFVHVNFNRPSQRNRSTWAGYVRKVEAVLAKHVTANLQTAPRGMVGKALAVLTWSKDSAFPPLPLMTESAILAMQGLLVKSPWALIEVS